MDKPKIICMTPIKNESWILVRFLKCASLWADHIIIADQSTDKVSAQIAECFSKVTLIDNVSEAYSEQHRQKLLIDAARQLPPPRLLMALDADEMLTANFLHSPEWNCVLEAPPGTVIRLEWVNIQPDLDSCWISEGKLPLAFVDDGSKHSGTDIHSPRIPVPAHANTMILEDIKCLHYQYTNWERMQKKQCWYQCWERINSPQRSAIDIFRQYHHMYSMAVERLRPLKREWLSGYIDRGIDMTSINYDKSPWIDREILSYFDEHGTKKFSREAIWNFDWENIAKSLGDNDVSRYRDPRNRFERRFHWWLKESQRVQTKFSVRLVQKALKLMGW